MRSHVRILLRNRMSLCLVAYLLRAVGRMFAAMFRHEDQPVKNLTRAGGHCPACRSSEVEFAATVPYVKTHLFHWGSTARVFFQTVPKEYWFCTFELHMCAECGFIYVDSSYTDLVGTVEDHPNYLNRIMRPYLDETQIHMSTERADEILSATAESLTTREKRYLKSRSLIQRFLGEGRLVLDLGSNTGSFAEFVRLSIPSAEVSGCEMNHNFVLESRRLYPELEVFCEELTVHKVVGEYDLIFCSDVIEHIWDLDGFVEGIKSNLALTGHVLFVTPNLECTESRISGIDWWSFIVPHHAQAFTIASLRSLMMRHGFTLESHGAFGEELWAVFMRGAQD